MTKFYVEDGKVKQRENKVKMSLVYCFDLDNTLCNTEGNYYESYPIQSRIDKVNKLYDEGNTIIIDTARGCEW